ncbi:hypothetical protein HHI36_006093 [Cryptolaemus montrouzieri]|uniref:Uncharacterized protein n=1 Tax=Cryptolaemus montrouzieri TaxID=559131 RepID=A0ABD2NXH7_9CUCU
MASTTSTTAVPEVTLAPAIDAPAPPASSTMKRPIANASKHKTEIKFDIANKTSLSDLAKRYNPPNPPSEAPTPQKKSTYFKKLDIAMRMELDHGLTHIIDVQPDLRFPFQYFLFNIAEEYPELTVKSHPYTSTLTLVAYQQILFNAYLLICDMYSRESISYFAQSYKNDPHKMDYVTKLLDCYVPTDLEHLLVNLAPTYDPQRKLQLFVPSFAAFDFALDFGRCIPPSICILAHHLLASTRTNADPETILRTFYATTIVTVENVHYTPAHFLGGYFDINQHPSSHSNWLNTRFEKVYNPVIGRALLQRPTLARTRLTVPIFDQEEFVNPYDFNLCYSLDNIEKMFEIISDISSFFASEAPSCKKLGQILDSASGICILYHSLWSITLPTHHHLPPPTVTAPTPTEEKSDAQYASYIKFLVPGPTYKSKLTPPPPDIDVNLYLVSRDPYDTTCAPFLYTLFDKSKHVYPNVLWFQPYHKDPSALNYSMTLGLLIEIGDIDGVTLPIPNIELSLTENNSMYLQGTLPLSRLRTYTPTAADNNRFRLCCRTPNADEDQPVGIALCDSSTVFVPRFASQGVTANINGIQGAVFHTNCNDPDVNFTYAGWTANDHPPIPDHSIHLWSSYRYVRNSNSTRRKVFLYYKKIRSEAINEATPLLAFRHNLTFPRVVTFVKVTLPFQVIL